ncbi:MAG: hypothetical protein ACYC40_00175 [Patescibacteria group bacterium]
MKTMLLIVGLMMASIVGFGQISLQNAYSKNIRVYSLDGLQSVNVPIGVTASVPFLQEANGVTVCKISHSDYKPGSNFVWTDDGEFTLAVSRGKAIFSNLKQKQAQPQSATPESGKKIGNLRVVFPGQAEPEKVASNNQKNWFSSVDFIVQNLCSVTFTGYSDPFLGLCLKANQATTKRVTTQTGNLQAAFGYDLDPDSTATGKNRKWAVLDKAIPEGTDTLKIYNSNLVLANTGIKAIKIFRNRVNEGYLIVNDDFSFGKKKVKTISPMSTQKIEFYLGWNVLALQYKDKNGYPKQEVLLLLVTEGGGVINLTRNGDKLEIK